MKLWTWTLMIVLIALGMTSYHSLSARRETAPNLGGELVLDVDEFDDEETLSEVFELDTNAAAIDDIMLDSETIEAFEHTARTMEAQDTPETNTSAALTRGTNPRGTNPRGTNPRGRNPHETDPEFDEDLEIIDDLEEHGVIIEPRSASAPQGSDTVKQ